MEKIFTPHKLGPLELKNKIVMAPMTRSRASEDGVQSELAIQYYAQRSGAGLMITEGSQVSAQGVGYINTPGIYNLEQRDAWKNVVDEVHKKDGTIFLQLWHVGRVSHPDFHNGDLPVAPSAIEFEGTAYTPSGMKKVPIPRALSTDEVKQIVEDFFNASKLAKEAGFDGVEIHGANGYLLDQFLRDGSNQREDEYGGSLENRMRFPLEVVDAVLKNFDASRVGYRVSPNNNFQGMHDSNTVETFSALTKKLDELNLGYLHIFEFQKGHENGPSDEQIAMTPILRKLFKNTYIVNGGYTKEDGVNAIENNSADLIAYGTLFISNPDLPRRFLENAEFNAPQRDTFYQGGEEGYTDYPAIPEK